MLTTIQSAIADDLDAFEKTSWFTSVYPFTMSALGPLNGKLSGVFLPRLSVVVSSFLLAAGSLMTGFANDFNGFVIGRAVTGIGASGVFTVSIIIVLELTESKRRGLAFGLLNSGYTFGVAVGATVAGALLPVIGWRALFLLQAIPALLGGLVLLLAIPMTFIQPWSLCSTPCPRPSAFPSGHLLRSRGLLLTCLGSVGFMMARWSVLFYAPTYALAVRQWAPSSAGAILIPTNAGFAAGGVLVGWLHVKRPGSFYFPTLAGYGLFPFTLAVLAALSKDSSPAWAFILVVFLCGVTTGAALNYNLAHLLHITPKETHYVATALLATFRGFAGSFGVAIGGGLFTRTLDASLKTRFAEQRMDRAALIRRLLGSPALVEQLDGVEKQIAVASYQDALKLLWLSMALIAAAMLFVQAGTGQKGDAEKRKLEGERQGLINEAQGE